MSSGELGQNIYFVTILYFLIFVKVKHKLKMEIGPQHVQSRPFYCMVSLLLHKSIAYVEIKQFLKMWSTYCHSLLTEAKRNREIFLGPGDH